MLYNGLTNSPFEREKYSYSHVWWDRGFTDEELNNIDESFGATELQNGVTFGETEKIRKSKINFVHKNQNNAWVFDRFNTIISTLNNDYYGFDLNGYNSIQYTVYDSESQGKYDWHMDILMDQNKEFFSEHSTRKLTAVMCLSQQGRDFVGGEFEMNMGLEENAVNIPLHKGKIIVFPSWMIHRVKPVIRGIRKSLVIWVEGPKFK